MGLKRLFEVTVALPPGGFAPSKIWLVLAEREEEARSLVPVEDVIALVRPNGEQKAARGPSRVIGWTIGGAV